MYRFIFSAAAKLYLVIIYCWWFQASSLQFPAYSRHAFRLTDYSRQRHKITRCIRFRLICPRQLRHALGCINSSRLPLALLRTILLQHYADFKGGTSLHCARFIDFSTPRRDSEAFYRASPTATHRWFRLFLALYSHHEEHAAALCFLICRPTSCQPPHRAFCYNRFSGSSWDIDLFRTGHARSSQRRDFKILLAWASHHETANASIYL